MAKTAKKPRASKPKRRKAETSENPNVHITAKKRKIGIDFSTSRWMEEGDHRTPTRPVIAFLVNDEEGNELVYHCTEANIPAEAKAALA